MKDREHDFVLTLAGLADLPPGAEDALFEAGCDDATISVRAGRVRLSFTRVAPSLAEAVADASRDVEQAGLGAAILLENEAGSTERADIASPSAPPSR